MVEIKFTIKGDPRPKLRPRLGKYGNVYTPKKTIKAEEEFLKQALKYRPKKPFDCPIGLTLVFYKKKLYGKNRSKVFADRRPDLDNYIKLAVDAMNDWFWIDDARIVEIKATKSYDKIPRTEVAIRTLEELK
jgi:Holliday junction resolvase RusA-like endonuclease